jgi:hypothetical protein
VSLSFPTLLLQLLMIAACVSLILALTRKRLQSQLNGLLFFVAAQAFSTATVTIAAESHVSLHNYGTIFWAVQCIMWVASLYLVYFIWRLGLTQYRGFHQLCAALIVLTLTMAMIVVALTTGSWHSADPRNWLGLWFRLVNRSVYFVAGALLLLLFLFLRSFSIYTARIFRDLALSFFAFLLVQMALESWLFFTSNSVYVIKGYLSCSAVVLLLTSWQVAVVRYQPDAVVETAPAYALRAQRQQLDQRMEAMNDALIRLLG